MTKEEILQKLAAAKANKYVPDSIRRDLILLYEGKLAEFDDKTLTDADVKKNLEIINSFYCSNQTFVTKEELISKGFDFSQWFTTSDLKHFFDVEENSFEYKDFKCGVYYIKTRDKNLERPDHKARLFFQIIKLEYERNTAEYKNAIKLLHDRKYAAGHSWAYRFDRDMKNDSASDKADEQLKSINLQIKRTIPRVEDLINSMTHTLEVFKDLHTRLEEQRTEDENWV